VNTGRIGFLLIAVSFPLYLLWKGRLPAYLSLMTGNPSSAFAGAPNSIGSAASQIGLSLSSPTSGTTGSTGNTLNILNTQLLQGIGGGLQSSSTGAGSVYIDVSGGNAQ
jgi:hypothetical protein